VRYRQIVGTDKSLKQYKRNADMKSYREVSHTGAKPRLDEMVLSNGHIRNGEGYQ